MAKKKLVVHAAWCKGCGICAAFCPREALSLSGGKIQADAKKCVRCGQCELRCPDYAIYIQSAEEAAG